MGHKEIARTFSLVNFTFLTPYVSSTQLGRYAHNDTEVQL